MINLEELMANSEHTWQLDRKGKPDDFAYEYEDYDSIGGHNGYRCVKCDYSFCMHCIEAQYETFESECHVQNS